jgi:Domain of unknown function (DUF3452)
VLPNFMHHFNQIELDLYIIFFLKKKIELLLTPTYITFHMPGFIYHLIAILFYRFFDKTFGDFFSFGLQNSNMPEISREIHRFGWLLFLTLRIDTPDLFKDLVSCVHGLVAVLVSSLKYLKLFLSNGSSCIDLLCLLLLGYTYTSCSSKIQKLFTPGYFTFR